MSFPWRRHPKTGFALGLAFAFIIGVWLRWYLLADQIFTDDEWHGFYYVLGKSPGSLLTHFSIPGATCIPLNFYTWFLGVTVGWSELMLRLPSLVCGAVCVVAGPLLARKFIGRRRAILLGILLAISPLLVFYSRICRPYSAEALLAFVALVAAAHWMQSGGLRSALLYLVTGVLAIYFHLYAVVAVVAPLLAALVYQVWLRRPGVPRRVVPGPSIRQWIWMAVMMGGFSAILVLPALIYSIRSTFFQIAMAGTLRLETVPRVAQLISGTGQPILTALFWLALVVGAIETCRNNRWFGWLLVSLYPLHALALILSRPDSAQSAIVLTRYCLPLVPVSLLLVACGIQGSLDFIAARWPLNPAIQSSLALGCVVALALTGPLPQCYVTPNNFTAHGAYQHRYGMIDWQHSFQSDLTPTNFNATTTFGANDVSPFYPELGKHPGSRPIVEYPMMVGDHFDPLYYYQYFHRRPVLVGYTTGVVLSSGLAANYIYGSTYVDQILSRVPDPSRVRFRNFVVMDDLAGMRNRGVEFVILHKRFEAQLSDVALPLPDLPRLWRDYRKAIGDPFYEDAHIIVYRL